MSILVDVLQYGTGSHTTSSEAANALATDLMSDGVVGAITNTAGVAPETGAFAVNAQGTPDTTVAVTAGVAYVTGTPTSQGSQRLRVKLTANQNITIAANASGSTRYDWIYIKLDPTNMANPNTAADNVATLVTSRSTSSATDNGTPPTYGYCIAVVTVANGFVTITNGTIADKRVQSGAIASSAALNVIPASALATSAIKLGYSEVTSSTSTTLASDVELTGLATTVTIPAGGRDIEITFNGALGGSAVGVNYPVKIWDGAVTSGTLLRTFYMSTGNANNAIIDSKTFTARVSAPAAGAKTYRVSIGSNGTATVTAFADATGRASLTVRAI